MLEKNLQSRCLTYVKELSQQGVPILAINQHGGAFSSRGVPDIILCIKGHFVAVELKVGDNTPTPLQKHWLDKIVEAGGHAYVCYTFDKFKILLTTYGCF